MTESPTIQTGEMLEPAPPARVLSVDALRGFDMFWIVGAEGIVAGLRKISNSAPMLFIAEQLEHKEWEGMAFEDLIFPLFVFLMGVATVFSLGTLVERHGRREAHVRLFRRFALLYVVGLFYYGGFSHEWPHIRLVGVLPRIATCYLFAGLLFLNLRLRGMIVAFFAILLGYWAAMSFVPAPGEAVVSFAPDHNLANWVDLHYLPGRLWNKTWDPEGLLSNIPAIASALLGVFAGLFLQNPKVCPQRKSLWLVGAGAAIAAVGWLWGHQFPVIKKLWTSSYVLVAGGYSAMLLGVFHQVIDVWKVRRWATPFFWIGSNALAVYMASNLIEFEKIAERFVGGDVKRALGVYDELALGLVAMALVVLFARFLHKKRIFIRL